MKRIALAALILSTVSILADPPASPPRPVQLQFIGPDTAQEDLLGHVKTVDEKSYKSTDGTKGDSEGRRLMTFNPQGCYLEDSSWEGDGSLKEKTIYSYDAQGNVTGRQGVDASGAPVSNSVETFDLAKHQVTIETKAPDGTLQGKKVSVFDRFGKEHEVAKFDGQGKLTERTTLDRDSNGKETSIVFYGPDNQPRTTITVTWNPNGSKATESIVFNDKNEEADMTYDYPDDDTQGNWTTQVQKSAFSKAGQSVGESTTISERVITYY